MRLTSTRHRPLAGYAEHGLAQLERRAAAAARWLKAFVGCMDRTRTFGLAAETAFWVFLSLVPLAAVMGMVAARLSVDNWNEMVPLVSSLPPAARDLVMKELFSLASYDQGTLSLTGAAVFLWLASSGVHALFDAIEIESGATRPWWKKRLIAIAGCLALSIAVAALALLGPGLEGALAWLGRWIPALSSVGEPTSAGRALRFVTSAGIVFGFVCAMYWVGVPGPRRAKIPIVPGAVLAVVLELCFAFGYGFYLSRAGDGGAYLAGLAIIGVTLTALYLFSLAVLVGAALNQQLSGDECPVPKRAPER